MKMQNYKTIKTKQQSKIVKPRRSIKSFFSILNSGILLIGTILILTSCNNKQKQEQTIITDSHPEWVYSATIYEVNIRQYTPEGTFIEFNKHISRLKDLGVDILWFMPIQTIGEKERKGSLGSYYSIKNYTEVNSHFGNIDDFKLTVQKAHDAGLKVILDWVANHTSHDAIWTDIHKEWYITDSLGKIVSPYNWTDVAKLNDENQDMRKAMIDAMKFWIREADIDGFRCDVAGEVPTDFWEIATSELKQIKPDIFMLAEAEKPELTENAFDAFYGWELHHRMNGIAQGKQNVDSLRKTLNKMNTDFPAKAIPMIFTSNHDENSWNGTEFERLGEAAKTFAILTYLLPGMPLIYSGQEVGFERRLHFFEKDSINWTGDKGNFTSLYRSMNIFRKENKVLYCQEKGAPLIEIKNDHPENVYSFKRESDNNTVIGIFNLSPDEQIITLDEESSSDQFKILSFEQGNDPAMSTNNIQKIKLQAWGSIILYK